MIKKFLVIVIPIISLSSQNLNFQFLTQELKNLAIRNVENSNEARKWLKEFQETKLAYNQALHWRGTMQGMEYKEEATIWFNKCLEREGNIKDLLVDHLTRSLDPYTRMLFRVILKQFTRPERIIFKAGAIGITVISGGSLSPTLIKALTPEIAHEVATILLEEKIISQKEKTQIDFYIDLGSLVWSLKNTLTAPDYRKFLGEASKFGLKITDYCVIDNKCNFTVQRDNISQSVVMEFETSETTKDPNFKITYPTGETINWNKTVRGTCSPLYNGYIVRVYIRTDKDYLQGTAIIDRNGNWGIDKTWPTKGTQNIIFAELYDRDGKKVATSNKVIFYP